MGVDSVGEREGGSDERMSETGIYKYIYIYREREKRERERQREGPVVITDNENDSMNSVHILCFFKKSKKINK